MDIYFLRHASAGDNKALTPQEDEKRPLDAKGIEQSKQMGKLLAALEIKPDAFVSSPLTRAVQTAELVAEQLKGGSSITLDDALRPDAGYEQFQDLLQHYARQKTIIVTGHNPNLSEFLSILISGTSKTAVELKKGAVAKVEYKSGKATLHWCVTPKLLGVAQESAAKTSSRPKTSRK